MGSSHTKDQNIDLYMNIDKQYYLAGQRIQGSVYLNAKTDRQYSNINVRLIGQEYIIWNTYDGTRTQIHENTYNSYNCYNLLVDFHGKVQQGQYQFPFSMILPSMMPGSFYQSSQCYIKYMLSVQLTHKTQQNKSQIYQMFLNILQPPRMPIGAVSVTQSVDSKCCGCCCSYGILKSTFQCNKNFVLNGDTVEIRGQLNNSNGKSKISRWAVALEERRIMISSSVDTKQFVDNSYILHQNKSQIQSGQVQPFNFTATIPSNIFSYTAIGRVVARYFVLCLYPDYGCCNKKSQVFLHLIVHSRSPKIVKKKQFPIPSNWSPKVYPKIEINNMKPYLYSPLQQLVFLNMPGAQNVIVASEALQSMKPDSEVKLIQNIKHSKI